MTRIGVEDYPRPVRPESAVDVAHQCALLRSDLARQHRVRRGMETRLAELSESAHRLSHDLGNLATGVTQALRAVGSLIGADDHAVLEDFRTRLVRLDAMMAELFDLVRPLELRLGRVPLGAVLRRVVTARPRVELDDVPADAIVRADATQLLRCLVGLVDHLTAAGGPPRVGVSVRSGPTGPTRIQVRGPGAALGAGDPAEAFEPFQQHGQPGPSPTLAVCQRLVRVMGGRIELVVAHRGAARFHVVLEAVREGDEE